MSYEKRLIGFIDILGFGQLVLKSENEPTKFSLIEGIISRLNDVDDIYGSPKSLFAHSNYEYLSEEGKADLDALYEKIKKSPKTSRVSITTFSDSIVFSCPADIKGLSNFRYFLIKLLVYTSEFNLLLRGGISCGSLIHSDKAIFGPAMNKAYHTESKIAKQPRIAVDQNFLSFLEEVVQEELIQMIQSELVTDPEDSVVYFDHLALGTNKVAQNMCGANPYEILSNEKKTIESLRKLILDNPTVRSKIDWYINYFNHYLKRNPEVEVVASYIQGMPLETIMVPVSDLKVQCLTKHSTPIKYLWHFIGVFKRCIKQI